MDTRRFLFRRLIMTTTVALMFRRAASKKLPPSAFVLRRIRTNTNHQHCNQLISPLISSYWLVGRECPRWLRGRFLSSAIPESNDIDTTLESRRSFQITSDYEPTGDQPHAIQQLVQQLQRGDKFNVLKGITGTGKTFVISQVIARVNKPTLVLCHNKTLAAQLARELRSFLRENAVELFVSYYNSYVPEYFREETGTFSEKKCSINQDIDALRHRATRALLERKDVVVVASVSCIFGLGLPSEYLQASTTIAIQDEVDPQALIKQLEAMLYTSPVGSDEIERGNYLLSAGGLFGTSQNLILSLWMPHDKYPMRIELETDKNSATRIKSILFPINDFGDMTRQDSVHIFPAKHHVISGDQMERACVLIEEELQARVKQFLAMGKEKEADRLQKRVANDLLLLRETRYCPGAENYSRHFAGRAEGEPPDTLLDYLKIAGDNDWLLVVDESHMTLQQLSTMYRSDRSRKLNLIKHGFRLPSALDNRPLKEEEFWSQVSQAIFVSATPSSRELMWTQSSPVEMVIRPTYVCDPVIEVRHPEGQLDHLVQQIEIRALRHERTLVMALTRRDAEDLVKCLLEYGLKATYIHCELKMQERSDALKALQTGEIDCLVGVNLLREGLDLPQVSLVVVLNADSQGFLRSETALLQIVGRAARNTNGKAIFFAKRVTNAMQRCMDVTSQRRQAQQAYNKEFNQSSNSTKGSSIMSIFDLLKDEIENEKPLEIYRPKGDIEVFSPVRKLEEYPFGSLSLETPSTVVTDHLPNSPGVYFWKDAAGNILYIGKAKKLRSRVKSYVSQGTKHSSRIKVMISKAAKVEFVLTPSERDALLLESKLIKHYLPPYNVLLKDDTTYPYICASVGDEYPRFFIVPRQIDDQKASSYRYFGPYPKYDDITTIMDRIEETYNLRAESFKARHEAGSKEAYQQLFHRAIHESFGEGEKGGAVVELRQEFEEAALLFGSEFNTCRDVVAIGQSSLGARDAVVQVLQLRNGLLAGRFSYFCTLPEDSATAEDFAVAIESVLTRQHYPSGGGSTISGFSFFPDEILLQYPLESTSELKATIKAARTLSEQNGTTSVKVRSVALRGPRRPSDMRAIDFAMANAKQEALDAEMESEPTATKTSLDGTATKELIHMLLLKEAPKRIECYDISHTQGEGAVASRVVFVDGKPDRSLYRRFNIKPEIGNDDCGSIEEVLYRRFNRVWVKGTDHLVEHSDPWSMPDLVIIDGGLGQLGAAVKGMAKAYVYPHVTKVDELEGDEIIDYDSLNGPMMSSKRSFVPICSLAKNNEKVYVVGRSDPVNDTPDSAALLLLRSLRDESHRFALISHRKRRSAELLL